MLGRSILHENVGYYTLQKRLYKRLYSLNKIMVNLIIVWCSATVNKPTLLSYNICNGSIAFPPGNVPNPKNP